MLGFGLTTVLFLLTIPWVDWALPSSLGVTYVTAHMAAGTGVEPPQAPLDTEQLGPFLGVRAQV